MNLKTARFLLYIIIALFFAFSAAILFSGEQHVLWDPGLCLKMTDNTYHHIPFNYYAHPSPRNIDKDEYEFVTWWSPGQFALPLLVLKCLPVKLSLAVKLLTLACLLLSAAGIFRLYRLLLLRDGAAESDNAVVLPALVLLVFTIFQPFFWQNICAFDGGGILMLAYCPWFIWGIIKIRRITILNFGFLLIAGLAGFFLKSSFTAIFAGALLYLLITLYITLPISLLKIEWKKLIKGCFWLGGVFLLYLIILKFGFLNYNRGISQSSAGVRLQARVLFYPLVAPVLELLSCNYLNRTIEWIIASVFIIPAYYFILKSSAVSRLNKRILISFGLVFSMFYFVLYLINVDVSYEPRHYLVFSLLLVPGLTISFFNKKSTRYLLLTGASVLFISSVYSYGINMKRVVHSRQARGSFSGLPFAYPQRILNKIDSLDNLKDQGRDIFYFKSDDPTIALEVRNNRVLLEDNYVNFHFDNRGRFKQTLFYGFNSGQIYMVYPLHNFKTDSAKYFTRFQQYKTFRIIYRNGGYAIFRAIPSLYKYHIAR